MPNHGFHRTVFALRDRPAAEIHLGGLNFMAPALRKWRSLMEDDDWDAGDAPWWYNERASLSIFAGALYATGSWAMEEFSTHKGEGHRKRQGRGDLMFQIGSNCFAAEAKQCWPIIRSTPDSAIGIVRRSLVSAREDARRVPRYGYLRRMSIVFVSPRLALSARQNGRRRLAQFLTALRGFDGVAMAWAFPHRTSLPKDSAHYYPGAAVICKPLRHS